MTKIVYVLDSQSMIFFMNSVSQLTD